MQFYSINKYWLKIHNLLITFVPPSSSSSGWTVFHGGVFVFTNQRVYRLQWAGDSTTGSFELSILFIYPKTNNNSHNIIIKIRKRASVLYIFHLWGFCGTEESFYIKYLSGLSVILHTRLCSSGFSFPVIPLRLIIVRLLISFQIYLMVFLKSTIQPLQ